MFSSHAPSPGLPAARIRNALLGLSALLYLASAAGAANDKATEARDEVPRLLASDGAPEWKDTKELKAFAARGDPRACFELATRMLYGDEEVPLDLTQAHALLTTAAAGGIANAHFRLGKLYHDGVGVTRDYDKALEHYTAAARQGVPEAQHNIGSMLVSARGVKRNFIEGLAWLLIAEEGGADSDAPQQVREHLARRPDDILAAERRAREISANLPHAVVRAESTTVRPASPPSLPKPAPAPKIEVPSVQPIIPPPKVDSPPPPQVTIPLDPPPTQPR